MIGIYKIENLLNHKVYIGQSINIEKRWKEHCRASSHSIIAKAIRKYGKQNFSFQVLEECSKESLNKKEEEYIKKYNSIIPNGYNIIEYINGDINSFWKYDSEIFNSIIKDLKDNILTIQQIADKYELNNSTIYYINRGDTHFLPTEQYPLREITKKQNCCIDCGKKVHSGITRCKECRNLYQRKVERPTRAQLKEEIRTQSFVSLGKKYGVTDNAIRKWCKSFNLPYKKEDIKKITNEEWEKI